MTAIRAVLLSIAAALMCGSATEAMCQPISQLARADGETIFSSAFMADRNMASTTAGQTKSMEPMLALLGKYSKPEEIAERELAIGMQYGQSTGLIDYEKSVTHLTRALGYDLPEHVWLQASVWRAGSLFILKRDAEALKDALRVLVSLSYRDMSEKCPRIENPTLPLQIGSGPPDRGMAGRRPPTLEEIQRMQDYKRYREQVDRQRSLSTLKYHAVDFVQRIQSRSQEGDSDVRKALSEVSPDRGRADIVFNWLKLPNAFPRCS